MKLLPSMLLIFLLASPLCPAENPVPFESLSFSVDVGNSWKRLFKGSNRNFSISINVSQERRGQRPSAHIRISCLRLKESGQLKESSQFSMADVEALAQVAAAAKNRKALKVQVPYYVYERAPENRSLKPREHKTSYATAQPDKPDHEWAISIKRSAFR